MNSQHQKSTRRLDMWREGTYVDLWSVVHTLTGIALGFGMYYLKMGWVESTILTAAFLSLYELWEVMKGIKETYQNRVTDVFVGFLGFVLAYSAATFVLSNGMLMFLMVFTIALTVTLAFMGWRASLKRERSNLSRLERREVEVKNA